MSSLAVARSLREHIASATAELAAASVAAPRHDAERLAAHALGVRWSDLWSAIDRRLDAEHAERFGAFVRRRAAGEPLAYIASSTVFYGLTIVCGPGALVPRPETETVVDVALELIADKSRPVVVDIGCGTGAIALAIATQRVDAEVIATDISADALAYARTNVDALRCRVSLLDGDLYDALPDALRGRVDLIVSNPPYVPDGAGLAADVRAEPAVAVFAGPDGNEVLARLASQAPVWLKPGGALVCEIGEAWQASVIAGAQLREDLTGRPRVAWATY